MIDAPISVWPSPAMALFLFFLGAVIIIVLRIAWRASDLGKPTAYRVGDEMASARATVAEWSGREGYVSADGELWRAISSDDLTEGDSVRVTRVDGLILEVKKA